MLCRYLDQSVKIGGFNIRYQEPDLIGFKYYEIDLNLYPWTTNHGRTRVKPITFYPPIFGWGNHWEPTWVSVY